MNTVGMFAGRGDVVLMMLLSVVFGTWVGWQLNNKHKQIRDWWVAKRK